MNIHPSMMRPNDSKPNFFRLVASKRSLIFVQNLKTMNIIRQALFGHIAVPVLVMVPGSDVVATLAQWHLEAKRNLMNAALLCMSRSAAHGFRVEADRVVWIGPIPSNGPDRALFMQCMGRANHIDGKPVMGIAYEESEIIQYV